MMGVVVGLVMVGTEVGVNDGIGLEGSVDDNDDTTGFTTGTGMAVFVMVGIILLVVVGIMAFV